jgi:hypothetical protein
LSTEPADPSNAGGDPSNAPPPPEPDTDASPHHSPEAEAAAAELREAGARVVRLPRGGWMIGEREYDDADIIERARRRRERIIRHNGREGNG